MRQLSQMTAVMASRRWAIRVEIPAGMRPRWCSRASWSLRVAKAPRSTVVSRPGSRTGASIRLCVRVGQQHVTWSCGLGSHLIQQLVGDFAFAELGIGQAPGHRHAVGSGKQMQLQPPLPA
jgi:hypothetical protein